MSLFFLLIIWNERQVTTKFTLLIFRFFMIIILELATLVDLCVCVFLFLSLTRFSCGVWYFIGIKSLFIYHIDLLWAKINGSICRVRRNSHRMLGLIREMPIAFAQLINLFSLLLLDSFISLFSDDVILREKRKWAENVSTIWNFFVNNKNKYILKQSKKGKRRSSPFFSKMK